MSDRKSPPQSAGSQPENRQSENRRGARFFRYAQVGGTFAGQAARLAGARLSGRGLGPGHPSDLRAALGGLKGPLMKVAQMMATIPDALPPEYAQELAQLQSNAPPMGKPFVRRRMSQELGSDWQSKFKSFDLEAKAAASLGQVHRAVLHDGRDVACKLQYPAIESAVEADLSQLKVILGIYRRWDSSINFELIYDELAERLREELDYRREAKNTEMYRAMLAEESHVHIPAVVPELSTGRLLTMGWLDGKPLLDWKSADAETRNKLAMNMFRAWYVPFYDYGVIHGDPHLGNYTVRPGLDINLLDFGCVRVFRPPFVEGVIDLYHAIERDDRELAVHAYEIWGFKKLTKDLVDALNAWATFIYGPLLEDRSRRIDETNSGRYGREVAGQVQRKLRDAGGVTPPREFVFMDRAAVGLGSVFLHLAAEINWHRLFKEVIQDFDSAALERRQTELLEAQGLPRPT